jgi:aspartyl-tRNA(Asn)/glutamyl-tRNA(Gln) amidotransferase subunit C
MAMDIAAVRQIAFLARIKVPDADLEGLANELGHIIGWVEQLNEVNTEGVQPIYSVSEMTLYKREDTVTDGDCREKVLANAPERVGGFYAVPKVVE